MTSEQTQPQAGVGDEALRLRLRAAAERLGEDPAGAGAARTEVWRDGKCVLYRYTPLAPARVRTPLLICYALVNRPYMLDLQPGHSLIRNLLDAGIDVYLIDWGYPDAADRFVDLNDYINRWLDDCVRQVSLVRGGPVNLLGVCQGGTLSLCYAALHPQRLANLITMVTPVDFQTPDNLLSSWARSVDVELMTRLGNVPGSLLNAVFLSLMPFRLTQQKYLTLGEFARDDEELNYFLRMERWIADSPDQAARAFAQFMTWFFRENRLLQGGLNIGGRAVELKQIGCPVLNVYAQRDHLVPPAASRALCGLTSSQDYQELCVDVGHIGIYVSSRAQREVGPAIAQWLLERDR